MDRVTKPQKKMLITLLRETKNMEGKKEKEWYWEKIQAALNTIGPKKTIIQWKKCWRDMRLTTRKKLAELKRCQLAGGSPPPGIELNHEDNDIIDIVGTQYFYEEMNGELKPENFLSNFDYVPEHFCDAILTAAAASSGGQHAQQHIQHPKEQSHGVQSQQDHHNNDTETNDAPVSSNAENHGFAASGFGHAQHYTDENTSQQSNTLPHPHAFHPHLLRRPPHGAISLKRENHFEEKLLQFLQEAFPKKNKKRKRRDPDKLFLLSLYDEIKRIPEEIRLEVKSELIQVLKRYQKKSSIKQEKSYSQSSSTSTSKINVNSSTNDKIQLPQQTAQIANSSMYQLQKKYDKGEKESSPQSLVDSVQHNAHESNSSSASAAVPIHNSQQISHNLFDFHKKFEENNEKNSQKDQRRHVESSHQQHTVHQQQQQPPPPPTTSNEQHHIHHPQLPHGIIFPLTQIRNESATSQQQHHTHNQHQQQGQQHHPAIFGTSTPASSMNNDRSAMQYESVG